MKNDLRHYPLLGLAALFGAACATTGATSATNRYPDVDTSVMDQATNPDLARAIYDEASGLTAHPFRSEDGLLTGEVLASEAPSVSRTDAGYEVQIEVADAAPVRCLVQEGVVGLSAFARDMAEAYLFSYEAHELKYVYAGARGGLPHVMVHGQYLEPGAARGPNQTGFFKVVVAGRAELIAACLHDQFGYRETLERITMSLISSVRSARADKPLLPLVMRSVYQITKDGAPIGAREVVIRADEEDFRQTWVRTTYLSQRSRQRLDARDAIDTFESDPDGLVITQTHQAREDGKLRADVRLEEAPMPAYTVRGTLGGAALDAKITVADGFFDPQHAAAARRDKRDHVRYIPELAPTAATACKAGEGPDGARVLEGKRVITGPLDDEGFWDKAEHSDGHRFERTHLEH